MKIAFVDPSKFSYPYDHSLLSFLSKLVNVTFFSSEFEYGSEYSNKPYSELKVFYPISSKIRKNFPRLRRALTPFKAVEHIFCSVFLVLFLKLKGYSVVHYQWCPIPFFDRFILKFYKKIGLRVFFTAHNLLPHNSGDRFFSSFMYIYHTVDCIFVHADSTKEGLINKFGVMPERVVQIKHGNFNYLNELEPFGLTKKELEFKSFCEKNDGSIRLLLFGLVRQYKGLHSALKALSSLLSDGEKFSLCVLGKFKDKSYFQDISGLISDLSLQDSVFITDEFVAESNISYLSGLCDVAIFPYENIDQSGALLAMASVGMPIVATRHDGFTQVVHEGENGYLYNRDEPILGLKESLLKVRCKLSEFSAASSLIARDDFSWSCIAESIAEAYVRVISVKDL